MIKNKYLSYKCIIHASKTVVNYESVQVCQKVVKDTDTKLF